MKGAVAAGHPLTAEAGARVLAADGNAVDACIAAAFVSWVTESPLTGPGAGGFMLVHRARDGADHVLDFFVAAPGRGLADGPGALMEAVDIAFDPATFQTFRVGPAACAVPGTIAGLAEAHRLYATRPWRELVSPAIELAGAGVELTESQASLHAVLDPVLRFDSEGRRIYGEDCALAAGARVPMPDLAATLELLAAEGASAFYGGELGRRVSRYVLERGGRITEEDLAAYRVVRRTPVRVAYRTGEVVSNPPPSSGGVLIAFALRVLARLDDMPAWGSAEAVRLLAEALREAARARGGSFASDLYRGGLAAKLLADERIEEAARRARDTLRSVVAEPAALPSTTHVSVVDSAGNAASLSASTGCGSGVVVPGTGIHLNNMLGEEDLNPDAGAPSAGRRLTSMMAPSIVLREGKPWLVVGSAGSLRLRAAILQIIVNVVDHGMGAADAVAAPRIHLDGDRLHLEGGFDSALAEELSQAGYDVVAHPKRNLYFGGASAVVARPDGTLDAAGDPRRGGAAEVVR